MSKSGIYIIGMSDIGESVCAAAGRISTQEGTSLEIFERSHDTEKNAKLISRVTASGHTSTVEHIFFNLAFENVSVVVEQFMIEFRLASFTVKSRRYVDFANSGYYAPKFHSDEDKAKYEKHMNHLFELYSKLTDAGIAKEDARFVLPYCFYSNFFCSIGGRELINVLRAMLYGRGKDMPEIYALGCQLLEDCKRKAPGIFENFEAQYGKSYNDKLQLDFIETENNDTLRDSVELLSYTQDAEKNVVATALIESMNLSSAQIQNIVNDNEQRSKVLNAVLNSSRPRALESVNYTVRFNNVSLSTLTHFTRHRIQSLEIPSLTTCDRGSYIIPPSVKDNAELLDLYINAFESTKALYEYMISCGYSEGEAVYCLLSGNTVDIVTTLNARELKLFMKLRTCNRAQWEIRDYAKNLLAKLRNVAPEIFSFYGPSCYCDGFCPEGRLSCGKMKDIKEEFASL
ncbi:MAG: FAD-dependent thymidylate synthase [Faecalibacterium sp.]|nr:FAD-dependent thymidylate synthase [Ruminococcus sp.]MCM1391676.1 FAD-dependent thymidylate synthase [Ruminococcus sp.]MCM1485982.1 FAD-dependent thymidylate synthase [Faecalibacterium sp.]